ncbi:MAG: hypothetical protein WC254_07710 [Candidatus Woesearchaeota archaeon]|jgi:hypothetical protein
MHPLNYVNPYSYQYPTAIDLQVMVLLTAILIFYLIGKIIIWLYKL